MVTDTGTTVRQLHDGVWVDIPVLIRNGHYCLCGDLHGQFKVCVGSRAVENRGGPRPKPSRAPRPRRDPDAAIMFPMQKRRLPRAVTQNLIDNCSDCGPHHEAFYYCPSHRQQAVRNVLLAARKRSGIISLHLTMADRGYDIVS
jgi:hypothetical protein